MGKNLKKAWITLQKIVTNLYTSTYHLLLCTMHCSRGLGIKDLKISNSFLSLPHCTTPHTNLYIYSYTHPLSEQEKATIYHFIQTQYNKDTYKALEQKGETRNTRL